MTSSYGPPSILPSPPDNANMRPQHNDQGPSRSHSKMAPNSLLPDNILNETDQGASQAAKMFVGGLPQSVTSDSLRDYFARYGSVAEAFVLMDESSGRSRGFGFVTFDSAVTLRQVLGARPHTLDNKQVDCKHAVMKGQTAKDQARVEQRQLDPPGANAWTQAAYMQTAPRVMAAPNAAVDPFAVNHYAPMPVPDRNAGGGQSHSSSANGSSATGEQMPMESYDDDQDFFLTGGGKSYLALSGDKWLEDCAEADERKIFVGGLPDVTPAEFASFFEHFGPVADAMVMFDRKRRRQRGFGFITFGTNEGVQNALQYHRHPVKGKLVEVKKAHPLVLQKARAPARRERDLALQAMMQRPPVQGQDGLGPTGGWPSARGEVERWPAPTGPVDPFGISHSSVAGATLVRSEGSQLPQFPSAPWNAAAGWRQPVSQQRRVSGEQYRQQSRMGFDDRSNLYAGGGDYGKQLGYKQDSNFYMNMDGHQPQQPGGYAPPPMIVGESNRHMQNRNQSSGFFATPSPFMGDR